jgi:hypothetical protein
VEAVHAPGHEELAHAGDPAVLRLLGEDVAAVRRLEQQPGVIDVEAERLRVPVTPKVFHPKRVPSARSGAGPSRKRTLAEFGYQLGQSVARTSQAHTVSIGAAIASWLLTWMGQCAGS